MKTILIDNIITPYEIARYNAINNVLSGKFEVWFLAKTDRARHWKKLPHIEFSHTFLNDTMVHLNNNLSFRWGMNILRMLFSKQQSIQRVICCGWDSPSYFLALLFCKIFHIHFTIWSGSTQYEKSIQRTLFSPLVWGMLSLADDHIVYGTRAKEYVQSFGIPKHRIQVFLNSVDIHHFQKQSRKWKAQRNTLRKALKIPSNHTMFLYVGQLIERKGVREMVKAFALLRKNRKDASLLLVGSGYLEQVLQLRVSDDVYHIPHVEYDELPKYYAISDVLLLPSKEEVWGLVVNEALASGIPVLVSKNVGSSADLIDEKSGVVIEHSSEESILKAMQTYFQKQLTFETGHMLSKMDNARYAKQIFGKFRPL